MQAHAPYSVLNALRILGISVIFVMKAATASGEDPNQATKHGVKGPWLDRSLSHVFCCHLFTGLAYAQSGCSVTNSPYVPSGYGTNGCPTWDDEFTNIAATISDAQTAQPAPVMWYTQTAQCCDNYGTTAQLTQPSPHGVALRAAGIERIKRNQYETRTIETHSAD